MEGRDMKVPRIIRYKPIEILAALALVGGGAYLAVTGAGTVAKIIGATLTGVGGLLASWSSATVSTAERAGEVLRPQLDAVAKHLGTVASQLRRVITGVGSGVVLPETGLALIQQANNTLNALVSDLEEITGSEFAGQKLLDTKDRLDKLAERLTKLPEEDSKSRAELEDLRSEIEELRSDLGAKTSSTRLARSFRIEKVACPLCGAVGNCRLGEDVGETAMPQCEHCGEYFYLHRRADGSTFTRVPGPDAPLPQSASGLGSYEAQLRRQGIRLVNGELLASALRVIPDAVAETGNGVFGSWEDFEAALFDKLSASLDEVEEQEVHRLRILLYRARVFHLAGANGIGLLPSSPDELRRLVVRNLAGRLSSDAGRIDSQKLAEVLFGDHPQGPAIVESALASDGS